MGVAKLKKVELYYHKSVQEEIAKILQHSGACQIIGEPRQEMREAGIEDRLNTCEKQQAHLRYLFRALNSHYTDPVSSLDRLLGEKPIQSLTELAQLAKNTSLEEIVSSVKNLEQALTETQLKMSQLKAGLTVLSMIPTFPYTLDILGQGTHTVKGVLGSLPNNQLEAFTQSLEQHKDVSELYVSNLNDRRSSWVVLMYTRTQEQQVMNLCLQHGLVFSELPFAMSRNVADESAHLSAQIKICQQEESRLQQKIKEAAAFWMPTLQKLSDYWAVLCQRYQAMDKSDSTEQTIRTCFWIPEPAWESLRKQLEKRCSVIAYLVSDPTEEDTPPSLLKNRPVVKPFEILTNLYSPPPYGETDPTPLLAPFFFLFFGICLGDAGYAVVMMGAIWLLFRKYRRIPQNVKEFILLFAFGAVATFLYGVVSGSFFGDFIDAFFFMAPLRSLKNAMMLVDPMNNPMQILGISLVLGVVHLMFGLSIAAFDYIRKKNYVDAVGDKIAWMFFIIGLAFVFAGTANVLPSFFSELGKVMAALGGIVIFWYAGKDKKGIFSKLLAGFLAIYGSTSYLGDILSYSRLLALGFGSAVIGMIINLLGGMAANIPFIGWLVAITVIVGGHLFGMAINILGAFVHSLRLQYVEFFGKFYSGGGTPFDPLSIDTQYVDISE